MSGPALRHPPGLFAMMVLIALATMLATGPLLPLVTEKSL
jgi:hypothetical protein